MKRMLLIHSKELKIRALLNRVFANAICYMDGRCSVFTNFAGFREKLNTLQKLKIKRPLWKIHPTHGSYFGFWSKIYALHISL